jgi:hypothetical protein
MRTLKEDQTPGFWTSEEFSGVRPPPGLSDAQLALWNIEQQSKQRSRGK